MATFGTGTITSANIADSAITTVKIANNAITTAKINDGEIVSADLNQNSAFVFNEDGNDNDTRIEGLTDINLFLVDASTDRVGMGIATPDTKLHVHNATSGVVDAFADTILTLENNAAGFLSILTPDANERGILFGEASSSVAGGIIYNSSTTLDGFQFRVNGNSTKLVIDGNGNIGIGTSSFGTSAVGTLAIKAGTAPTANVVDVAQIYVDTAGLIKYRDDTGGVHTLGTAGSTETFGAGKETKTAEATWTTSFSTTSATFVDLTDATVTISGLDSGKTYSLFAVTSFGLLNLTSGAIVEVQIVIDSTAKGTLQSRDNGSAGDRFPFSVNGMKRGVTGATSYIAKLQVNTSSGTATVNLDLDNQQIMLIAMEE